MPFRSSYSFVNWSFCRACLQYDVKLGYRLLSLLLLRSFMVLHHLRNDKPCHPMLFRVLPTLSSNNSINIISSPYSKPCTASYCLVSSIIYPCRLTPSTPPTLLIHTPYPFSMEYPAILLFISLILMNLMFLALDFRKTQKTVSFR